MLDLRTARGFQDSWKNRSPRGVAAQSDLANFRPAPEPSMDRQLTTVQKATLSRIARRVPEVVVRVGRATTKTADGMHRPTTPSGEAIRFGNRLTYITRNDKIELETSDGSIIATKADRLDFADEWTTDQADYRDAGTASDRTRLYRSIILSMPPGTDPVSVQDAARAFAQDEFAGHKWLMALHTDTDHPHVHLDVQTVREDGRKLSPGKDDLERYREGFARHLRDIGIDAEATPRHARGSPQRASNPDLYHLRNRRDHPEAYQWPGRQEEPRADVALRECVESAPAAAMADRPGDLAAKDRRQGVIETYLAAADALRDGGEDDRKLAVQVDAFVSSMPAYAPRLHIAAEKALEGRVLDSGKEQAGQDIDPSVTSPQVAVEAPKSESLLDDSQTLSATTFARVYAKPHDALERWTVLVADQGLGPSLDQLRTSPDTLGGLAGRAVLGIENTARRDARAAFGDLIMDLRGGIADLWAMPAAGQGGGEPSPPVALPYSEADQVSVQLAELRRQQDELAELQRESLQRLMELNPEHPTQQQPGTADPQPGDGLIPQERRNPPEEPEPQR